MEIVRILLTVLLIWVVCGVLAYGLLKGFWKRCHLGNDYTGHNKKIEFQCCYYGLSGPVGLLAFFVAILFAKELQGQGIGLCYRMPKELWEPREKIRQLRKEYPDSGF